MKKILNSPSLRLSLLAIILLGLLALHFFAPVNNEPELAAASKAVTSTGEEKQRSKFGVQIKRPEWEPSGEDIFVALALPIPEPEAPAQSIEPPIQTAPPPPPPEPVAPPLPYTALARFETEKQTIIYLGFEQAAIPVKEGDLLGNGQYQIEKISGTSVSIRYLPMNHLHELSLSGLE